MHIRRILSRAITVGAIFAAVLGTSYVQAAKKKLAAKKPQLVVVVSQHSPECAQLKQRLSSEQDLLPLVQQFNVTYLDIDNDPKAANRNRAPFARSLIGDQA